jgi:hypothetical protein
MTTINLFQPGKLNVYLQFPTEWDELASAEVLEVCRQQLLSANNAHSAKAAVLYFILHNRARVQKVKLSGGWFNMTDPEQMYNSGCELIDFIFNENNLTAVPEKVLKLPGLFSLKVYGPTEGFQDLTCAEFEEAEIFFNQFIEAPNAEAIARLAAVLYRPAQKYTLYTKKPLAKKPFVFIENGKWQTYDPERLYKRFQKLLPWRLYAVFVWYHGCRNQLPLMFPTVHDNFGESKNDEPDILAFTKCIHAGAGPKNGTRNEIRRTKLLEFMFEMEQEAIKAKEMKEEYEKLKNQH